MFICSPIGSYCVMRKTYSRCYRKHGVIFVFVKALVVVVTLGSFARNAEREPVTPGEIPSCTSKMTLAEPLSLGFHLRAVCRSPVGERPACSHQVACHILHRLVVVARVAAEYACHIRVAQLEQLQYGLVSCDPLRDCDFLQGSAGAVISLNV